MSSLVSLRPGHVARSWAGSLSWLAICGAAVVLGLSLGSGTSMAWVPLALVVGVVAMTLPLGAIVCGSLAVALLFRTVTPHSTGPLSVAPDALVALVVLRCAIAVSFRGSSGLPRALRMAAWLLVAITALMVASTMVNGDTTMALVNATRQFLRFPVWTIAVALAGLSLGEARWLLRVLLATSLIQLPFALMQFRALGPGDAVAGTFGSGGSGVMMIFLVLMAGLWLAMALERSVPWWVLALVAPALVLPMGLGSAAMFVVFLPTAVFGVVLRHRFTRAQGLRFGMVLALAGLLTVGAWAAQTFAVAPPCAGCQATSATSVYDDAYLSQYYRESLKQGPDSRLGFLFFAMRTDARAGARGVLLGAGPGQSFLGAGNTLARSLELSRFASLQDRSVQSLQRVLLGMGFVVAFLFLVLMAAAAIPSAGWRRDSADADRWRAAVLVALPVLAFIVILAAPYTAAWSDPGVSAAFWALVLIGHVKASSARSEAGKVS